ncbi:MAG: cytochrome c biogenesis heme-transporting ATPase CcmA [Gammaproteobacteria bacterium]|jgi:heme exporter protein A|nr:cytochrome c biogenesis heme-transporting ATPase CcmA [Gammaproteobacteria bacterium]MDP6973551.1 cytochrome c biogenesis heme-transporting ATPase CcmA [Gammaproteobacteria bacterium]
MSRLIVNDLSCQRGYNELFSNLSFELSPGEILRISGANGSGKTSLLRIIAGISSGESGNVTFNNNPAGSIAYQSDIFYLGHLPALSPELHCKENLDYLTQLNGINTDQLIDDALANVGLINYKHEYAANLSAGQKRRVVLAALFVTQSRIWLLDEPFTAIDADGIKSLENQITKHCENGGFCILTTHQDSKLPNLRTLEL